MGPTGAQGATGPGGPSNAFDTAFDSFNIKAGPRELPDGQAPFSVLSHLDLPDGSYVAVAYVTLENSNGALVGDNSRTVTCVLANDAADLSLAPFDYIFFGPVVALGTTRIGGFHFDVTMSLNLAYTPISRGDGVRSAGVDLACRVDDVQSPSQVFGLNSRIDAIQVANLSRISLP